MNLTRKLAVLFAILATATSALLSYAGWQIGSINLRNGDTSVSGGYTTVSVEAISDTSNGVVSVYHIHFVPVTNTLATLTLSQGHAVASTAPVDLKSGDILYATGAALTNGSAHVTIRK